MSPPLPPSINTEMPGRTDGEINIGVGASPTSAAGVLATPPPAVQSVCHQGRGERLARDTKAVGFMVAPGRAQTLPEPVTPPRTSCGVVES